ncbi:periplasmic nitrate reductase, NapE protein [Reinekea marina]|uniref:Periplasmic nitrate reductase, NapE protein n=1 Tax=Reinekea marina TaxID=1310421 RepID=A0ABV7WUC0_9GAMM|nr:periplasmic nitrate reductase, NapE protein [Reinekea marina]MDN3648784.1 periplasmic nitrate reductase, NapE protein [Reinekea marina]
MSDLVKQKQKERNAFLFITVILFPLLTVAIVGGYGFIIWMSQLLFGSHTF